MDNLEYADTTTHVLDKCAMHDWEYDSDEYLEWVETLEIIKTMSDSELEEEVKHQMDALSYLDGYLCFGTFYNDEQFKRLNNDFDLGMKLLRELKAEIDRREHKWDGTAR